MTNQGKVDRVLREALTVFVEELGREDAIAMLEMAVAQLRDETRQAEPPATRRKPAWLQDILKRNPGIRQKR